MAEHALPAHIDVDAAEQLKQAALNAAAAGEGLTLNAEEVASISCAGVQTVIAAARCLEAAENRLVLAEPSDAVIDAFEGLGFMAELVKVTPDQ